MQQRIINILFSVVIVILTGTVVYLTFGNKSTPVTDITPAPVKTTAKVPVVTTDETANWKTYLVSGYNGYEFKYPQSDTLVTGNELQNKILNASGYWGVRGGITEVAILSSQSTFSVGRHEHIATLAECKKITWPNDQTEELTTTKVINGITYYFGTYTGVAAGTQTRFNVYHAFGGSGGDGCFELVVSVSPLSGSSVSDQILSTFKFTNPTSDPATSNWKTYSNTEFGYSFKYPATYTVKEYGTNQQEVYETSNTTDDQGQVVGFYGQKSSASLSSIIKERTDSRVTINANPTTINGILAYEGVDTGMISWYVVFVKNNADLVEINFNSTDKGSFPQDKAALTNIQKLILSTFKFTK